MREIEVNQPRIRVSKELRSKLDLLNQNGSPPVTNARFGSNLGSEVRHADTEAAVQAYRKNQQSKVQGKNGLGDSPSSVDFK